MLILECKKRPWFKAVKLCYFLSSVLRCINDIKIILQAKFENTCGCLCFSMIAYVLKVRFFIHEILFLCTEVEIATKVH